MTARNPFSSALSGVLYAEDFDEAPAKPTSPVPSVQTAPEPPVKVPSFSLEELRSAVEQAWKEGRDAERLASAQSQTVAKNNVLATIAEEIRLAHEDAKHVVERSMVELAETTVSLLSTALPELCSRRAETDLRAILHRLLPIARQMPELQIRVNPAMRKMIEAEITMLLEGAETQVTWTESPNMAAGDIAIGWQNGLALRDTNGVCANIRNAVVAMLENGRETQQQEKSDVQ